VQRLLGPDAWRYAPTRASCSVAGRSSLLCALQTPPCAAHHRRAGSSNGTSASNGVAGPGPASTLQQDGAQEWGRGPQVGQHPAAGSYPWLRPQQLVAVLPAPPPPSPPPPPVPAALPGAAAGPSFPPCPCTAKPSGAAAAAAGGSADPPPPCPSIGTAELPGAAAAAAGGSTGSAAHRSGGPGGALPPGSPDARGRRPAHARRPPLLMTGSSPGVATGGQQRQSSRPRVGGVWHVRGHPFPGQHRYQATCLVPLLAHTFIATAGAALLARGASAQLYHTAHAHPPQSHAAALPALGVGDCAYSSSL